jgi:8-oxo-dGTP pyrophosphatase MutT (NUDIX family)
VFVTSTSTEYDHGRAKAIERTLRQCSGQSAYEVFSATRWCDPAMRRVKEVSAGGVIYREHEGHFSIALIHVRKRWGLPKGHVEEGEHVAQTAVREVREETGLVGKVEGKLGSISYTYRAKSKGGEALRISKRVTFFLLRYSEGEVYGHDYEVDEARWFPIDEAFGKLTFETEKKMVRRALSVLTSRSRRGPAIQGNRGGENS